ncbi:hypothetical protein D3C84_943840 [compost metagenome]
MHHRFTHLDPGRIAVEQDPPDLLLQHFSQPAVFQQLFGLADQGRGQLPAQAMQRRRQLRPVLDLDDNGGRPEHFLLQQFIALEQQADIGLEHLRLCLIALLRLARQMSQPRMFVQLTQASAVAGQCAGIEHGLRRLLVHARAKGFQKRAELR